MFPFQCSFQDDHIICIVNFLNQVEAQYSRLEAVAWYFLKTAYVGKMMKFYSINRSCLIF